MKSKDSLGSRMKENYENRDRYYLTRRTPVIVRVDGKAFHTYTKKRKKPFDEILINNMCYAALKVASQMQGCKAFYVQSDEASFLLTDYDDIKTQGWFDYNKSKIETISASVMSVEFNWVEFLDREGIGFQPDHAYFDARAFNIPKEEVVNYFLWRMRDWSRNSVNMLAMEYFSTSELHGKNTSERIAMLESLDVRWNEYPWKQRNGSFWVLEKDEECGSGFILAKPETHSYENIDNILKQYL